MEEDSVVLRVPAGVADVRTVDRLTVDSAGALAEAFPGGVELPHDADVSQITVDGAQAGVLVHAREDVERGRVRLDLEDRAGLLARERGAVRQVLFGLGDGFGDSALLGLASGFDITIVGGDDRERPGDGDDEDRCHSLEPTLGLLIRAERDPAHVEQLLLGGACAEFSPGECIRRGRAHIFILQYLLIFIKVIILVCRYKLFDIRGVYL